MKHSRALRARNWLLFWTLFIGLGAVAGAAGLLLRKKPAGVILGGIFGITLMLWICIQFYMFPLNFMSTAYFLFGAVQAATGYAAWVFAKQEAFRADPKDYKNVGTDPRRLVVYFSPASTSSRMALMASSE